MNIKLLIVSTLALIGLFACQNYDNSNSECAITPPLLTPDYQEVTIPSNIAPLNFRVENATKVRADIRIGDEIVISTTGRKGLIDINPKKWSKILYENAGKKMSIEVTTWSDAHKEGIKYKPFEIYISTDSIDRWISYRLIEPGYEDWGKMGIYQRDISSFEEAIVIENTSKSENTMNDYGCINCHSFANFNADCLLFHARNSGGGTIFYKDNELSKVDFKTIGPNKQATYPQWNHSGQYVAFSSNSTNQNFYAGGNQPIEVFDTESDLILYDTEQRKVITDPRFMTKERWETYPAWSPDGKWLYLCSANGVESMPQQRRDVHYDIIRVAFDEERGLLGEQVDTIYNSRIAGGSASYPRVSPDGRYLMFTHSNFGTFPIWHNEADLRVIELNSGQEVDCDIINSDLSDSYHSWSSSGRWVVFGSRRLDGRYTRLFITHCSEDGKFGKPFLLPQEDPDHNVWRLKSYNVPEFTKTKIMVPQDELKGLLYGRGEDHRYVGVN